MSLSARAKAVRGLGYAPLLRAVQGLLTVGVQTPVQPPPNYGGAWPGRGAYAHTPARSPITHSPRRTRRRRELDLLFLGQV